MSRSQVHRILEFAVHWSLIALMAFPVLPLRISTFVAIIYGASSVLHFMFASTRTFQRSGIVTVICFSVLPLVYLSELPMAENQAYVWREVQRKMGLVMFPLLFFLNASGGFKSKTPVYLNVFSIAAILVLVKVCTHLVITGVNPEHLSSGGMAFALRTASQEISGLHPTYMGLVLGVAVLWSVKLLSLANLNIRMARTLLIAVILVSIAFTGLLGARMALLAMAIATLIMVWREEFRPHTKWFFTAVLMMSFLASVVLIPTLRERFIELLSDADNSTTIRGMIYSCSVELVRENWLFGLGVERLQHYLDMCYQQFTVFTGKQYFSFNTHNEFLNVMAAHGVFGLFGLLILLGRFIAYSKRSPMSWAFLVLFVLVCLTENLLERQIGVFTISIIGGLLVDQEERSQISV